MDKHEFCILKSSQSTGICYDIRFKHAHLHAISIFLSKLVLKILIKIMNSPNLNLKRIPTWFTYSKKPISDPAGKL